MIFSDQSIPTLESVFAKDKVANEEITKLAKLITRQANIEAHLAAQSIVPPTECTPPPVVQEFQTARLFLSHFGLLNLCADAEVTMH